MGDISKLGFDYPDIAVHGVEVTAPAAGAVLADSGPVGPGGHYRFRIYQASNDTAGNVLQLAHRNAANTADIELQDYNGGGSVFVPGDALFTLAAGERVVVRNLAVGTAAKIYQVNIFGWLMP